MPAALPLLHNVPITGGYCWRTQKCRNVCIPHAFQEGKKARETYARKSTARTLKEIRQQYPEGFRDTTKGYLADCPYIDYTILFHKFDVLAHRLVMVSFERCAVSSRRTPYSATP